MSRSALVGSVFVAAVFIGIVFVEHMHIERATIVYVNMLEHANARETVSINGHSYDVSGGVISNSKTLTLHERFEILGLAYAKTLARRSPLLGIAGTDSAGLETETAALAQIQQELAQAQTDSQSRELVAQALYPIGFLSALASLENAREQFLQIGSLQTERAYNAALANALANGQRDLIQFTKAFDLEVGSKQIGIPSPGGTVTTDAMETTLKNIGQGFAQTTERAKARQDCLSGLVSACDAADLEIPSIQPITSPQSSTAETQARLIENLYAAAADIPTPAHVRVALAQSRCLGLLPGPYYFAFLENGSLWTQYLRFIGNAFFISTDRNSPTLQYLRNQRGMEYSLLNPLTFYVCPDAEDDLGRSLAVRQAALLAATYPSYAPSRRTTLMSDPYSFAEGAADTYISQALAEALADPAGETAANQYLETALMFTEKSAGLEQFLHTITAVETRDLSLKKAGVPFDVSASTLFLSHSAFPSLFLLQNPAAGTGGVLQKGQGAQDTQEFFKIYLTYENVLGSTTYAQIVHDTGQFVTFENGGSMLK